MEDNLAKHANRVLICDTNSFATEIWHERYVGYMSLDVAKVSAKSKADLYLITDTDIPFVQDGTRDGEHQRENMHQRFVQELTHLRQKFIVVSGTRQKRLSDAIRIIDQLPVSWKI